MMKSKLEKFRNYELNKSQTLEINGASGCLIPCIMEFKSVDPGTSHKWMIETCDAMCKYQ